MMASQIHLSDHFSSGKLLRFTLPAIAMNIFTSLYVMVDGFFVANFAGKSEFAALTLIMPVLNILGTIGYMFGVGGNALVAKTLGENEPERAKRLFSLIVLASSVVGALLMVLGFILMPWIAGVFGAEGKLLADSVLYGRIFILALPAWIWVYEFQLFFVAAEKPRLGLYITILTGLCNVVLDALFLIVFRWGIAGAAAASALTQLVGGVFSILYFARKNDSILQLVKPVWDGKALVKCCANGSSEFMAEAAGSFIELFYNVQLMRYIGENGVIIFGLLMYVNQIFSAIFVGYSNGVGPLISYQYGARGHSELRNLRRRSMTIIVVASVTMFVLSGLLARPFSALFLRDGGQLLSDTVHAFRIYSFAFLFMGIAVFTSAFFTALNNGQVSALISFLRMFVFELAAVMLFPLLFGVDGIWSACVFAEFMAAATGGVFMVALQKKYHY